ncbi:MAG: glutamate dehydrogenase, partial [Phascolarctobacterium sp.]|nr:glutamate dehydrogenase [Phascolarctobacterium sp.]
EEVIEKQVVMMRNAFKNVHAASEKYGVNMRVAAYIVALNSLDEAMKIRGMY